MRLGQLDRAGRQSMGALDPDPSPVRGRRGPAVRPLRRGLRVRDTVAGADGSPGCDRGDGAAARDHAGFVRVPMFLVWFGLDMNRAAGTSLVVATALSAPALLVHGLAGDVNWTIALTFGLGLVPGAFVGSRVATHLPVARLRIAFGVSL